ncbi:acyl CoA binding protein-domain-containing protein [Spinellus fusiger]|nr:acyl CoA binding protein-domain-containing protein [Spinellus fusiger]
MDILFISIVIAIAIAIVIIGAVMSASPFTSSIEKDVQRRYTMAVDIVQRMSASTTTLQPTKQEILELYALDKQLSYGNVHTPRPGLFDITGKSRWDAWKALENISSIEAKCRYVDILLAMAVKACNKEKSRSEARSILETFTTARPLQKTQIQYGNKTQEDVHHEAALHPLQTAPHGTKHTYISPRPQRSSSLYAPVIYENFERKNPWSNASHSSSQRYNRRQSDGSSEDSIDGSHLQRKPSFLSNTRPSLHDPSVSLRVASHVSGASTTTTTTSVMPKDKKDPLTYQPMSMDPMSDSVLGPTTKRAIDLIQSEILLLGKRIDDLTKELSEYTGRHPPPTQLMASPTKEEKRQDTSRKEWRWILIRIAQHIGIHFATAFVMLVLLYSSSAPFSQFITSRCLQLLHRIRMSMVMTRVVV